MIDWIMQQTLVVSLALMLLLSIKRYTTGYIGAQGMYRLWALVPFAFSLSWLPQWSQSSNELMAYVVTVKQATQQIGALIKLSDIALVVWLGGVLLLAANLVFLHKRYLRTLTDVTEQSDANLILLVQLTKKHNLKVYRGANLNSPCVVGWIRPGLVLPSDFEQRFDSLQQQLIVEHELTHKRRGDLFFNLLAQMFLLLFWFNPLAWVGYRAFRQSQELACDALVLKDSDKFTRVAYAKAMLLCAEQDDGMFYTSIHYGAKNDMQERLLNIKQHTGTSFWRWSAIAVSMMVALFTFHSVSAGNVKDGSEVHPLIRVEPLYPPQAAEQGIEGSVVLSFDINTQGKVENVKVVQAQPKGIFDRNSKIALRQWTYSKPSAPMKDMHVQLDYALSPKSKDVASLNSKEIEQIKVIN